jgi:hypothetical protein
VGRRRLVVPVLFGLSGLGWAAAHAIAHRAVMAEETMSTSIVERYLSYLTTSVALCFALALPLAAGALVGKRWKSASVRSLWLFGLVPVVGFVGHAVAEPLVAGAGTGATLASVVPIALVGLLIQIPFALVAVGVARHVLWLAERIAHAIAAPARARLPRTAPRYPRPRALRTPGFRLDLARSERGPPPLTA